MASPSTTSSRVGVKRKASRVAPRSENTKSLRSDNDIDASAFVHAQQANANQDAGSEKSAGPLQSNVLVPRTPPRSTQSVPHISPMSQEAGKKRGPLRKTTPPRSTRSGGRPSPMSQEAGHKKPRPKKKPQVPVVIISDDSSDDVHQAQSKITDVATQHSSPPWEGFHSPSIPETDPPQEQEVTQSPSSRAPQAQVAEALLASADDESTWEAWEGLQSDI